MSRLAIDVDQATTPETINIGGVEYDKAEVEAKLKGLKPIKRDIKNETTR